MRFVLYRDPSNFGLTIKEFPHDTGEAKDFAENLENPGLVLTLRELCDLRWKTGELIIKHNKSL